MKNKRTDHINKIKSKRLGIFRDNFAIFFSNAGRTGKVLEFDFSTF